MRIHALTLLVLATACGPAVIEDDLATRDRDGDGFTANVDCDDARPEINPGAIELCNGFDDDCDGQVDPIGTEGAGEVWVDDDGDGFGAGQPERRCDVGEGFAAAGGDCNDGDAAIHPLADEICNGGIDDNCDGTADIDAIDRIVSFLDDDGDTFGDSASAIERCDVPPGWVEVDGDCNDADPAINPAAPEVCDGLDNDCTDGVDDDPADALTWWADADGDGYGDASLPSVACLPPPDTVPNDADCDDAVALVSPAAVEVCNEGVDDDCDTLADDADDSLDTATASAWWPDLDGDGYGDDAAPSLACAAPTSDHLDVDGDCDDTDDEVSPDASEVCGDFVDNDCDLSPGSCGWTGTIGARDADLDWVDNSSSDAYFGGRFSSAGDLDDDGYADVLITTPRWRGGSSRNRGKLWVLMGGPTPTDRNLEEAEDDIDDAHATLVGPEDASASGWVIMPYTPAGDVTGDGIDDLVIATGAPRMASPFGDGRVSVFEGPIDAGSLDPARDATAHVISSTQNVQILQDALLTADTDGDGTRDLVFGNARQVGTTGGRLFVFEGGSSLTGTLADASADVLIAGSTNQQLGVAATAGDFDADGTDDLVVTANPSGLSTSYHLFLGDGLTASMTESDDDQTYSVSARSSETRPADARLSGRGDLDGDGYDDLVIGMPGRVVSSVWSAGQVEVFLDFDGGTGTPTPDIVIEGSATNLYVGASAQWVGDLDGDGRSEFAVTSTGYSASGVQGGTAIYGADLETGTHAFATDERFFFEHRSSRNYSDFDCMVCAVGAGDVDGDGYDDLLLNQGINNSSVDESVLLLFGKGF